MTDLTPQGSAAVRLAQRTAKLRRERDRARDLAVALEQRLARVENVVDTWVAGHASHHKLVTDLRAALEADQ